MNIVSSLPLDGWPAEPSRVGRPQPGGNSWLHQGNWTDSYCRMGVGRKFQLSSPSGTNIKLRSKEEWLWCGEEYNVGMGTVVLKITILKIWGCDQSRKYRKAFKKTIIEIGQGKKQHFIEHI